VSIFAYYNCKNTAYYNRALPEVEEVTVIVIDLTGIDYNNKNDGYCYQKWQVLTSSFANSKNNV
jgi:hypothetical protein